MTQTKSISSIRAIKDFDSDTVLIYRAVKCKENDYEISVERYKANTLFEISSCPIHIADAAVLDKLLFDMCIGSLEPCHLKDIISDLN